MYNAIKASEHVSILIFSSYIFKFQANLELKKINSEYEFVKLNNKTQAYLNTIFSSPKKHNPNTIFIDQKEMNPKNEKNEKLENKEKFEFQKKYIKELNTLKNFFEDFKEKSVQEV